MLYYNNRPRKTCQPDLLRLNFCASSQISMKEGRGNRNVDIVLSGVSSGQVCFCAKTPQASRQACCSSRSCLTYFEFAFCTQIDTLKGIIPLTFSNCCAIVSESSLCMQTAMQSL